MALYKELDEIVINKNERIKFVGATVTKTKNPTAWIRRRYTVVCTGVSGQTLTAGTGISIVSNAINNTAPNIVQTLTVTGNQISISGGNTQTLPTSVPTYTTGTTAPGNPKVGDIWNDTNPASGTKPTILRKEWNGSVWYSTNGTSQSSLGYDAITGDFSLSINGQSSSNIVNILSPTIGTWGHGLFVGLANQNNTNGFSATYIKTGNVIDVQMRFNLIVGSIQAGSSIIDVYVEMTPFPIPIAATNVYGTISGSSNGTAYALGNGMCLGTQAVGFTAPFKYWASYSIQFPIPQPLGTTIFCTASCRYSI